MKINIQSISFHASDHLIEFAENKINKIYRFNEMVMEAHVTLKVDRSGTKNNKICEIRLVVPGNDLYASKRRDSFEAAILETTEALRQPLIRLKKQYEKVSLNNTSSQEYPKL